MKDKLVHKLRKHDEKAFEEIIDEYTHLVVAIINNVSKGGLIKEDIEETVADVFVTLWNNADKVQDGKLKGYISCIARTRALNKMTACISKILFNIDDYDPEDNFSIEAVTEEKDISHELKEIIKNLKQPDKEILIRYYYYNQTVSEISKATEINVEIVKSKLKRTRDKIKSSLLERGYTI
ncbi:MAG: sigma-70 family RNA polymerase sigma factor [Acutalibacteraceae bacterium]|nr:sigma-70 family RNA polymerase sigma factor [Acutalibacteraceae bacterium]